MNTYVTADHHFHHSKIMIFCNRPFHNTQQMNAEMIRRWNSTVKPEDQVIHLGDFSFGLKSQRNSIKNQLNGKIFIIRGNHDPPSKYLKRSGFVVCQTPTYKLFNIIFSHQPLPTNQLNGNINVHAHLHDPPQNIDKYHINAGVDFTDFYPVPIEYYIQKAEEILECKN
jgi:calcineurin-like phosphoesterase family protein